MRLGTLLVATFISVSLVATMAGAFFIYAQANNVLTNSVYQNLAGAAEFKAEHIKTYLSHAKKETQVMATSIVLTDFLLSDASSPDHASKLENAQKRLDGVKRTDSAYDEVFLIGLDGKVLLSTNRNRVGADKKSDTLFTEGIKQTYMKSVYLSDVTGQPQIGSAAPVLDSEGKPVGVYVVRLSTDDLNNIAEDRTGLGQSGEMVVINRESMAVTPLRYKNNAVLNERINTSVSRACLADMVEYWTEPDEEIAEHEESVVIYDDYRGVKSIGAHSYAMPEADWCIVAKMDEAEALGVPRAKLVETFAIYGLATMLAIVAAIIFISIKISQPITALSSDVSRITRGDLNIRLQPSSISEVQSLTDSLNRVLASLKLAILRSGASKEDMGLGDALAAKNEAEERYAALFNGINDIVVVNKISPQGPGKFVDVNDYACRTFGYSREELLNMGPQDLDDSVAPKDAKTADNIRQMLSGKTVEYTSFNRTKDGRRLTLQLSMRLISIKGEKYIISTGRDITEKLETEGKYKAIFEGSSDAIMTLAPPDWKFTNGNPAALRMFGVKSVHEFTSLTPGDLSPKLQPDGKPSDAKAKAMIGKAMAEGANLFEWTHKRYKGEEFPAAVLLSKVSLAGKEMLIATVHDLADEKKHAGELSTIFESASTLIIYKDRDNRFVRVNKAFADSMGMKKEELEGKPLIDIFPRKQAEAYWKDDKEVMASGKPKLGIVEPMPTKAGTRWVQTDKVPYRDAVGKITGVIAFITDITAIKEAESEMRQEKEKRQTLAHLLSDEKALQQAALDAISDSFFVCDTTGRFKLWNKDFQNSSGYSEKEIASMNATDFFSKADAARVALAISSCLRKGKAKVTAEVVAKDGTRILTEFTGSAIRDHRGKIVGFAGVGRELSRKRK